MKEMSIKRAARPARSSELFAKTRATLLRRVNVGDHEAFEEFYNLYAPAMLKYLGFSYEAATERDQLDIVQTVFAKFYKAFALVEDPNTGKKRVPRNIFEALCKTDKKNGKSHTIRFRQYLIACMKNAVQAKRRADTKNGKASFVSADEKIKSDEDTTWGLTENNVYVIMSRAKDMAKSATRAVFKMLAAEDVEIDEAAEKLYKAVAVAKPSRRHADKFLIGLTKELLGDLK